MVILDGILQQYALLLHPSVLQFPLFVQFPEELVCMHHLHRLCGKMHTSGNLLHKHWYNSCNMRLQMSQYRQRVFFVHCQLLHLASEDCQNSSIPSHHCMIVPLLQKHDRGPWIHLQVAQACSSPSSS